MLTLKSSVSNGINFPFQASHRIRGPNVISNETIPDVLSVYPYLLAQGESVSLKANSKVEDLTRELENNSIIYLTSSIKAYTQPRSCKRLGLMVLADRNGRPAHHGASATPLLKDALDPNEPIPDTHGFYFTHSERVRTAVWIFYQFSKDPTVEQMSLYNAPDPLTTHVSKFHPVLSPASSLFPHLNQFAVSVQSTLLNTASPTINHPADPPQKLFAFRRTHTQHVCLERWNQHLLFFVICYFIHHFVHHK
ncbi:hypothetical protein HO133_001984 [Letharia lupina]|uniref:Uncharacterized protein n=1 Tax=Letharia lupina TaxID=560253 RepID=A0A8H6CF01_9LECA|nr:uncharacterized protein HO133_001984 [Letharia lupina]KAF6222016.1 hypothetical protein HO133_001984 [Letharia lupina]